MKHFLTTFLAVIVAQIVLGAAAVFGLVVFALSLAGQSTKSVAVPHHAYVVQEIPAELLEYDPPRRFALGKRPITETMILENLERARLDDRIEGVVLKMEVPALGWGKMEEIRERIHRLREAGKRVYAYTPFANNRAIYLASACDSVFVTPGGIVWFTGLMGERMYLKNLLDEIGVGIQLERIKEYKAAPEMFVRTDMSGPARENATSVIDDIYADLRARIAQDRGVDEAKVDAWLETGQFSPEEARRAGLIDGVVFWEELTRRLSGGAATFPHIAGRDYASIPLTDFTGRGPKVAVIHGQGTIAMGQSGWALPYGITMGEETMVKAIDEAADDDAIEGILLRLDTPGGLGLASDEIGEAVARAAAAKPMVVSSVDMNASGGYMVSYRCSTIVAPGDAIVGSIGSFAVRPDLAGLMDKLGITYDRVTAGPHGTLFSAVVPMSEEEFRRFGEVQRGAYDRWIAGVARMRGMTVEHVDQLGRGQVYTGRQGLEKGLIDAVGGFDTAMGLLKQRMGLSPEEPVTLIHSPVPKSILEEVLDRDWMAARAHAAALLGLGSLEPLRASADFWEPWLRGEDELLLCEWRF